MILAGLLVFVLAFANAQELEQRGGSSESSYSEPFENINEGGEGYIEGGGGSQFNIEYEASGIASFAPSPGSEPNALWILQNDQQITQLNVPFGGYARLRMIPGVSGRVQLFEQYPSGQTYRFNTGKQLDSGNWYRMGFIGDESGRHIMWYTVNGVRSNEVVFNVGRQGGSGGSGGSGGCQTNQYSDKAAANAASCSPGSATACCGSPNSCVDCSSNCYSPGRYSSRAGDVICSNGRWSLGYKPPNYEL